MVATEGGFGGQDLKWFLKIGRETGWWSGKVAG